MNETAIKLSLTGVLAILSLWTAKIIFPVCLLILSMVIDYVTGLMATSRRGDVITSYQGRIGIFKKVSSLLLVAAGLILDCLIVYAQDILGLSWPWSFVLAAVIAIWLTVNEVISILENVQDIGVTLPVWLPRLVKSIQRKVDAIPGDIVENMVEAISKDAVGNKAEAIPERIGEDTESES